MDTIPFDPQEAKARVYPFNGHVPRKSNPDEIAFHFEAPVFITENANDCKAFEDLLYEFDKARLGVTSKFADWNLHTMRSPDDALRLSSKMTMCPSCRHTFHFGQNLVE